MNKAGIYCIRFGLNERFYIGSSMKLNRRKSQHLYKLRRGTHDNPKLQNYYNKYGEELFSFNILEVVNGSLHDVRTKEQEYLNKYFAQEYVSSKFKDKRFDELLLNVNPEVDLMRVHWTDERKLNLIERNKNYIWTEEQRIKMSNSKKGLIKSKEDLDSQLDGIDKHWSRLRLERDLKCITCNSNHIRKLGRRLNKTKNIFMQRYCCMQCNKRYSKPE